MEDEDFEVEQMIKRHKKAGGVLVGNGTHCGERDVGRGREWPLC